MPSLFSWGTNRLVHALDVAQASRKKVIEATPEPTSLDDLCSRLKHNEITMMKVGYCDSDFLGSKRSALAIDKALSVNSSLRSVSIGWRHRSREALSVLLRAIARHTRITGLQLILNDWIPERALQMVLHCQAESLVTIDIRALQVLHKTALGRWCCERSHSNNMWPNHVHSKPHCDHNVVSRALVRTKQLPCLHALHLVDCGIEDKQAIMLADYLHTRRGGIAELSLRSNRQLGARGVVALCLAPVMQKLDLSLCDMEPKVAARVGPAIASRPWPLKELLVCGNYRMGMEAQRALVSTKCLSKVVSLNMSYCDVTDSRLVAILHDLLQIDASKALLREISLQGSNITSDKAVNALMLLLKRNLPLRVVRMNDPSERKILNPNQLRVVSCGIQENFEIELLGLDFLTMTGPSRQVWREEIDFYLRLNRAGRRLLLDPPQTAQPLSTQQHQVPGLLPPPSDWFEVLERAGDDLQTLYWIVRHSADRF